MFLMSLFTYVACVTNFYISYTIIYLCFLRHYLFMFLTSLFIYVSYVTIYLCFLRHYLFMFLTSLFIYVSYVSVYLSFLCQHLLGIATLSTVNCVIERTLRLVVSLRRNLRASQDLHSCTVVWNWLS